MTVPSREVAAAADQLPSDRMVLEAQLQFESETCMNDARACAAEHVSPTPKAVDPSAAGPVDAAELCPIDDQLLPRIESSALVFDASLAVQESPMPTAAGEPANGDDNIGTGRVLADKLVGAAETHSTGVTATPRT